MRSRIGFCSEARSKVAWGLSAWGLSAWGSAGGTQAGAGSLSYTAFTSYAAIRANMAALINALTPSSLSQVPFRLSDNEADDFRSYAGQHDGSVLREYEIELVDIEEPGVHDLDVIYTRAECELVIAYPSHWGEYDHASTQSTRWSVAALHAIALEDRRTILRSIGRAGSANYLAGQHAAMEGDISIDDGGDGVHFLTIPLELIYYQQA